MYPDNVLASLHYEELKRRAKEEQETAGTEAALASLRGSVAARLRAKIPSSGAPLAFVLTQEEFCDVIEALELVHLSPQLLPKYAPSSVGRYTPGFSEKPTQYVATSKQADPFPVPRRRSLWLRLLHWLSGAGSLPLR